MYLFFYMAIWILMAANPLQGPLEGVGPENRDFLGPEMATLMFKTILIICDLPIKTILVQSMLLTESNST